MTYPLRLDRDALTLTWGKLNFAITNLRKTQGGFAFTATPEVFSASEIEVYPDERILLCDRVPHALASYRVEGHVVIAETTVDRPDDPELVALMARRVALVRAG